MNLNLQNPGIGDFFSQQPKSSGRRKQKVILDKICDVMVKVCELQMLTFCRHDFLGVFMNYEHSMFSSKIQ